MVFLFVLTLLMASFVFVQVGVEQSSDIAYIEPPEIYVNVGKKFNVTVIANVTFGITGFSFTLNFDPTQMSVDGVMAIPPWSFVDGQVGYGYVWAYGTTDPSIGPGSIPLARIWFDCDAEGTSELRFAQVNVFDPTTVSLPWQGATVHQQWAWYFKPPYGDYAPRGVPDFDQRQDSWNNSAGAWTWCGPVAVANSLWWLDSKFEPNPVPPPTINDGFPLVTIYNVTWDDHDPNNVESFVNELAYLMDTDGQRTGSTHKGTRVSDMEAGIEQHLLNVGMDALFDVKTVRAPDEVFVSEEVMMSSDVILLLGFYQYIRERWYRIWGHFVTVSGVNPPVVEFADFIAFSDPIKDNAEAGGTGIVLPPPPHPHNSTPPYPLHNNASYISHDIYEFREDIAICPGGVWGLTDYVTTDIFRMMEERLFTGWHNFPEELEEEGINPGGYDPWALGPFVEVEYAIIVSPIRDVAIYNVIPRRTAVWPNSRLGIDVTVVNEGLLTETFNVTTYYNATVFSEGFEGGTFAGWDFYYSTNGAQSGSLLAGTWSSSIVSGASALSGSYSARLFADSDLSGDPWRVDAAINQTVNRNGATKLKAMLKFDQITDPGAAPGHAYFYISIMNALNTAESVTYGFDNSTSLTPGDISYNVSPGDLVNFEADIATDYFNKHGKALPQEVMILSKASADYAEPSPGRQTIEVRLDDIAIVVPSTPIETKTVTLTGGGSSTVITFTWNTAGVPYGKYTISAVADIVPRETDTADNTFVDGRVFVTIPGDITGPYGVPDGIVDKYDLAFIGKGYGKAVEDLEWDEYNIADITGPDGVPDGVIDIYDLELCGKNYEKTI